MAAIGGIGVLFNGIVLEIQKLLFTWNPGKLATEKEYQESLFNFLQAQLPDCVIRREYPEGGSIVDIYLRRPSFWGDEEVLFELKHNLSDSNEYKRLLGQLMEMKPEKRKIAVVLCGNSDRSMVQRLREHFKDHLNDGYTVFNASWEREPQMAIVVK